MSAITTMRGWFQLAAACLVWAACTQPNPDFAQGRFGDASFEAGAAVDSSVQAPPMVADVRLDDSSSPDDGPIEDALSPTADVAWLDGGATTGDTAVDLNTPGDAAADRAPDAFVLPPGCGTGTAPVETINNANGVVVDTDGTLYYLNADKDHSYLGRIRPGGTPERNWRRIEYSPNTSGLALDSEGQRLYVLIVNAPGALLVFNDIRGAAEGDQLRRPLADGTDLTVGSDGTVYYSVVTDNQVHAISRQGASLGQVARQALGDATLRQSPAALAFDPAGNLLVGISRGGPVYQLTLTSARETARATIANPGGWANGLTFDRRGRLYVANYDDDASISTAVIRLEANGASTTITGGGRFASITFGRGSLDCRDLYVASPGAAMRRVRVADSL